MFNVVENGLQNIFVCVKKDSEINPSGGKYRKLHNIAIVGVQFDDYWQLLFFF